MLVSYNLLKEYVDLSGLTVKEVTDKLSLAGFELDGINYLAQASNLVIGEVLECENHPNSDHLHVTKTCVGNETLQIVCGAPNCRKGLKVIVALPGAVLPAKGITIEKGVIRGVESNGMLCSLLELGVDENTLTDYQKAGIEELPNDAIVGNRNVLEYLGLDDTLLDISVTPNRGDVLAMYSFIKEVSAILDRKIIKEDKFTLERVGKPVYTCSSDTDKCNYFSITEVDNIKIAPSPEWMQKILKANDIKVINNIVDIGNYVTLMTGQPLHMYDAAKLSTNRFVVKDDKDEDVVALDGKTYHICKGDLVVTNGDKVVCIAGVIGDDSSKIDENTKNIAVEAALFDGYTILNSCKKFNILTTAATNYSKNCVDKYNTLKASSMACDLLVKYAMATRVSEAYEYDKRNLQEKFVSLDLSFINKRLSLNLTVADVENVFRRLQFEYNLDNETFTVHVPTYRNDIEIKEDILEEIIRLVGYDNVPYTIPNVITDNVGLTIKQKAKRTINEFLLNIGLTNTLSYTLINKDEATYYGNLNNDEYVVLPHPLTVEKEYLRKNMICSMLKTVSYNQARGVKDVAIYEISTVYSKQCIQGKERLAIAISNNLNNTKWLAPRDTDFYLIKGIVEGLLKEFGIDNNRYQFEMLNKYYPTQHIFHPGKSAVLKINGKVLGWLGEIHPLTLKREGIDKTVYFELDLSAFLDLKTSKAKYTAVSKYPFITRDIALIVKEDVDASFIIKSIKKAGGPLLTNCEVFDVYQGEHIQKGYKSIALTMTFNDQTKTLEDNVVNELFNKIYLQCQKDFNGVIR